MTVCLCLSSCPPVSPPFSPGLCYVSHLYSFSICHLGSYTEVKGPNLLVSHVSVLLLGHGEVTRAGFHLGHWAGLQQCPLFLSL